MVEVSLELVLKRVDDVLAEQKAMRAELVTLNEKVGGLTATVIGMKRELSSLTNTVAVLAVAVDDHTHRLDGIDARLERIEKKLNLTHA